MVSSCIKYFLFVHSVCGDLKCDAKGWKSPSSSEAVVMVQRVAANSNWTLAQHSLSNLVEVGAGSQAHELVQLKTPGTKATNTTSQDFFAAGGKTTKFGDMEDVNSMLRSHQREMIKSSCVYMLGILTIPNHADLRWFARNSWIEHLPSNVCYLFLYDQADDISEEESFDGLSLNSSYQGRGVRFGEKLYKYYSYVDGEENFKDLQYVVKMDDDVVLCPESLFSFLEGKEGNGINTNTYAGVFHNKDGQFGAPAHLDADWTRADEMFVLIGRDLVSAIASKQYCESADKDVCDQQGQLYDTNYGGTSLGLWLATLGNANCLQLNGFLEDIVNDPSNVVKEGSLLYHPAKAVEVAKEKFAQCYAKENFTQTMFAVDSMLVRACLR